MEAHRPSFGPAEARGGERAGTSGAMSGTEAPVSSLIRSTNLRIGLCNFGIVAMVRIYQVGRG